MTGRTDPQGHQRSGSRSCGPCAELGFHQRREIFKLAYLKVMWVHPFGRANGGVSSSVPGWLQVSFSRSKELSRIRGPHRPQTFFPSKVFFSPMSIVTQLQMPALSPTICATLQGPLILSFPIYPTGQMFSSFPKKQMRGSLPTPFPWVPTLCQTLG